MGSCEYVNVHKLVLAFKAVVPFCKLSFSKEILPLAQHSSDPHTWCLCTCIVNGEADRKQTEEVTALATVLAEPELEARLTSWTGVLLTLPCFLAA